jgi:hypothetical protein
MRFWFVGRLLGTGVRSFRYPNDVGVDEMGYGMDDKLFDEPVTIRLTANGKLQRIRSANDASAILASVDWPGERTAIHRDAFETAEKVLEGYRSTEDAKIRFLEAAREAGILFDESHTQTSDPKRIYFESSVSIRPHGSASVREVKSVNGASEVLVDWPHSKRGPYYQSARETIEGAIEGKATPDQARDAFVALAEYAGILVDKSA